MYPETIGQKINKIRERGHTKNWYDFFYATILLFILGNVSAFIYPLLNLYFAFFTLAVFCLGVFLVFQGVANGNT